MTATRPEGGARRRLLIGLLAFLGVTSVGGGIGLLTGTIAPGLELLAGSLFSSYLVPGLALLVPVGGSGLLAAWAVWRRHPLAAKASLVAAAMILTFELVEVAVIGYHPLQLFYALVGAAIAGLVAASRGRGGSNGG